MHLREVTVFSEGNALDLSCWSNVPYFFTKALENKGIKVNRVNIYSNKYIRKLIWNPFFLPFLNRIYPKTVYNYEQTRLNRFFIKRRIRKALNKYKSSDLSIFMSYAYRPMKNTDHPYVLLSDWTTEYLLKYRLHRAPFGIEKRYLNIQRDNIAQAGCVISLFPDIARDMTEMYGREIHYLDQNVVNNADHDRLDEQKILNLKEQSNILLFIGGKTYIDGARTLIRIFPLLKKNHPDLTLHIIGLSDNYFDCLPDAVFCHGYLNKSEPKENALYYSLLRQAKVFINPTSSWAAFSAAVEALYFYTPVIISPYSSFIETFGTNIAFGSYIQGNTDADLEKTISRFLADNELYISHCLAAHKATQNFTWDHYVDRFLAILPDMASTFS